MQKVSLLHEMFDLGFWKITSSPRFLNFQLIIFREYMILKSVGISHDARRNPCMIVVSWRLAMNFAREPLFAEPMRKSGSIWRSALATTNSDGGMPGRMVRSHDPNWSQTSLGAATARYWSRPWATMPAAMKTW